MPLQWYQSGSCIIEPIRIWDIDLRDCGFDKSFMYYLNEDWFIYYNDMIWMQVETNGTVCERIGLEHIQFLHELQNFIYSATGKELTIKL